MVVKLHRPLTVALALALALGVATPASAASPPGYPYDQPGDKHYVANTNVLERFSPSGGNNTSYKVEAPRAEADATFTTAGVAVDGVREEAWDAATAYPIENSFTAAMTGDAPSASTEGTVRLLWDGPVLYALVEVTGDTTKSDTGTPNWTSAAYTPPICGVHGVTVNRVNSGAGRAA